MVTSCLFWGMVLERRDYLTLEEASHDLAGLISGLARAAVRDRGRFTMALAGGNTPRPLYRNLGRPPYREKIPWDHCHLFWGDERWLPADDPAGNYAMVRETLLNSVRIPEQNIHRMVTELANPAAGAAAYEETLRRSFPDIGPNDYPALDLILLGMGTDGHTASLFPGSDALADRGWVVPVEYPLADPPVPRLTMTLPLINRARCVLFLVAGEKKKKVVESIRRDPETAARIYPAARVRPRGRLIWAVVDNRFGVMTPRK